MVKISVGSIRDVFKEPKLTTPGGLTQSGGYMAREIDIKSRVFPAMPHASSGLETKKLMG